MGNRNCHSRLDCLSDRESVAIERGLLARDRPIAANQLTDRVFGQHSAIGKNASLWLWFPSVESSGITTATVQDPDLPGAECIRRPPFHRHRQRHQARVYLLGLARCAPPDRIGTAKRKKAPVQELDGHPCREADLTRPSHCDIIRAD